MTGIKSPSRTRIIRLLLLGALFVPFAVLLINICFTAAGNFICDSACRQAALAASGKRLADEAKSAAQNALKSYSSGIFSSALRIPDDGVVFSTPLVRDAYGNDIAVNIPDANYANGWIKSAPSVQVTTQFTVESPIPIFIGTRGLEKKLSVLSRYVFPVMVAPEPGPDVVEDDSLPEEPPEEKATPSMSGRSEESGDKSADD